MSSMKKVLWSGALVIASGLLIAATLSRPGAATADLAPDPAQTALAAPTVSAASDLRADRLDRSHEVLASKADMTVSAQSSVLKTVADRSVERLVKVKGVPVKLVSWLDHQIDAQATMASGPIDLTASFKDATLGADFTVGATSHRLANGEVVVSNAGAVTTSSGISNSSLGDHTSRGSTGRSAGAVGGLKGAAGL